MADLQSRQSVRPDEILPGDVFVPRRGPCAGVRCRVVDVLRGRYSTYNLMVLPLEPIKVGADYTEQIEVTRAAT